MRSGRLWTRSETYEGALPRLWVAVRRRYVVLLVLTGLGQALSAGAGAHVLKQVLRLSGQKSPAEFVGILAAAAILVGLLRMSERVLTERLSQHYVHEIRMGLVRRNLTMGLSSSIGVSVARVTNDLTSVKNWVAQGVAPLASGLPLIAAATFVMALLNPWFAAATAAPVAVLGLSILILNRPMYEQSRLLRRVRGKLSGHIADAILATRAIRSSGGIPRELDRIERLSKDLMATAIGRARYAGALRGSAATTVGLISASVVTVGLVDKLAPATVTAGLTVVGFLATPIHDLGKCAEYRQTYRAARRKIAPAFQPDAPAPAVDRGSHASTTGPASVTARDVPLDAQRTLARLDAVPGDRIVVNLGDRDLTSAFLARFAGLTPAGGIGEILIDGVEPSHAHPHDLRSVVGYAGQGMLLPRGPLSRAVRYRCPDADEREAHDLVTSVGLGRCVDSLADGLRTQLRHGGEPLTIPDRARVLLAAATMREPALLVLDHLDNDLDPDGRAMLHAVLKTYPGAVMIASDRADMLVTATHQIGLEGSHGEPAPQMCA